MEGDNALNGQSNKERAHVIDDGTFVWGKTGKTKKTQRTLLLSLSGESSEMVIKEFCGNTVPDSSYPKRTMFSSKAKLQGNDK
ncbi:hypothetical protein VNO77_00527 [Canavalia gladiata]|uniref:Uncharacterized protein n=1 Tax=Canavalia gladiata TaxID=3824 RepID=A0AAN9R9E2_CANGL